MGKTSLKAKAPPLSPEQRTTRASTPPESSPIGSSGTAGRAPALSLSPKQTPEQSSAAAPQRSNSPIKSPRAASPRHSPRPGSPSAGPLRSPKPAILYAQQRSVGAVDLTTASFAAQALTPQSMRRSQILALDAGHARVHLTPQGQAEDRGAKADRNLRRLLGTDRLHRTGSSPGRSTSPGSARVRDTLARQRLVRESEAAAKLNARHRSLRQGRSLDLPVPASPRQDASNFTSALAEARARTSLAVTGASWMSHSREPEPEPEPELWGRKGEDEEGAQRLYPDTVVSQWGAYMDHVHKQPTALKSAAGHTSTPRVEDAAKTEILRAQKARLKAYTAAPKHVEEPPEPVLQDPSPEPAPSRRKPILCVQGGVHTHGPDGCALCNSVREAALNGTLVVQPNSPSPGKWLSSGSPTPAQLGYHEVDPQVPQLVDPSLALAYQSPLRRGESLRSGHSIPSLLSPAAGASGGLFGSPDVRRSALRSDDGPDEDGYVSPLRKSTWNRNRSGTPT
jgi:hypothetical protein